MLGSAVDTALVIFSAVTATEHMTGLCADLVLVEMEEGNFFKNIFLVGWTNFLSWLRLIDTLLPYFFTIKTLNHFLNLSSD